MSKLSSRPPAKNGAASSARAPDQWSQIGNVGRDEDDPALEVVLELVTKPYGRASPKDSSQHNKSNKKRTTTPPDSSEKTTPEAGSKHPQGPSHVNHEKDITTGEVAPVQSSTHDQGQAVKGASKRRGQVNKDAQGALSGPSRIKAKNTPQQQPPVDSSLNSRKSSGRDAPLTDSSKPKPSPRKSISHAPTKPQQPLKSPDQPRKGSPKHREKGSPGSSKSISVGPPSPIQAGETEFVKIQRLPHVAELDIRARMIDVKEPSVGSDMHYFLELAVELQREAQDHIASHRLSDAFIAYDRAAIIILQRLPAHPAYFQLLSLEEREKLSLNGQKIISGLSSLEKDIARSAEPPQESSDQVVLPVQLGAPTLSVLPASPSPSVSSLETTTTQTEIPKTSRPEPSRSRQGIDELQEWLDNNTTHPQRQSKIKKLIEQATQRDDNLPSNLFINGVFIEQADSPVASGSFADVYLGVYGGEQVAVKRFRSFVSNGGEDKIYKRFCREALLWRQLKHPRILPFLGIDRDALSSKRALIMISPWMAHGTLLKYLEKADNAILGQIFLKLIMDIAEGLKYLHDQSLAHGDLHGSNVFVDDNGRALLGDFGLTAVTDLANLGPTTTINKAGAIRWLGPEFLQLDDGPPPRKTSTGDIFAFGRLCLCIYTRRAPYHAIQNDAGVLFRVSQNVHPAQPTEEECHGNAMPPGLWDLILDCWKADPKARPTVNEVIKSLRPILRRGGA